jgi:hypothetical protein
MNQSLDPAQVHEYAEISDIGDLAGQAVASLKLAKQAVAAACVRPRSTFGEDDPCFVWRTFDYFQPELAPLVSQKKAVALLAVWQSAHAYQVRERHKTVQAIRFDKQASPIVPADPERDDLVFVVDALGALPVCN